jgi:hypothetical protein
VVAIEDPAVHQRKKKSRFRCDWLQLATVTSKTGMRSLSTDCDSEQEPQPRKLSCRISIRLEEIVTRHCLLNASEGMIFRDSRFCKEELAQKRFHPPCQGRKEGNERRVTGNNWVSSRASPNHEGKPRTT